MKNQIDWHAADARFKPAKKPFEAKSETEKRLRRQSATYAA